MPSLMTTPRAPHPESLADSTRWPATNPTAFSPTSFQRFSWRRQPRPFRLLRLGLGSLLLPGVGPLAWYLAHAELSAIDAGLVSRRGRGWIVVARLCGIVATCALVAATLAVVIAVSVP